MLVPLSLSLIVERMSEPVVVIGYSFRDAPVNIAFTDAFKVSPNIRVFSLGPHASAHQFEFEEPLKSKVTPVDTEFGSDNAIEKLRTAVQS